MSFYCDHCKYRSTQVQYGGKIQPKGCTCTLNVKGIKDVNRQVIKSDFATIKIPHLQFEIPPESRQGVLSTVQGFLTRAADDLDDLQPDRRVCSFPICTLASSTSVTYLPFTQMIQLSIISCSSQLSLLDLFIYFNTYNHLNNNKQSTLLCSFFL